MLIEQARVEDIAQLAALLRLLFSQEADFQPDLQKQERGLHTIIKSPEVGRIFVARDGDKVIGMVNLLFTISTAEGGPVCLLEDMIVHPDHRGGTGSRLLQYAIDFARASGFVRITLLTDQTNAGAIQFYKRHGFTPSEMTALRLSL